MGTQPETEPEAEVDLAPRRGSWSPKTPRSEPAAQITAAQCLVGILVLQYFLSADYAVFPAAFLEVQKELAMTDFEMGVAGSLVFSGLMASTCVSAPLLVRWPQATISVSILGCAFSTFASAYAPEKYTLYVARFLVGIFHGPCYTFFPTWVDTFAPRGLETRWMGWLNVIGPLANVGGYAMTSSLRVFLAVDWRETYAMLAGCVLICWFFTLHVPQRFWPRPALPDPAEAPGWVKLLPYGSFWLLMLVPVLGYYCVCAVEYYAARMFVQMGEDERKVPQDFVMVAVAGPVFFILLSGPVFDYLGGYRNRKVCLRAVFIMLCTALLLAPGAMRVFPSSLNQTVLATTLTMGLYAATVPPIIGLVLMTVQPELRSYASGLFAFLSCAVGFQLGPVVSGAVMTKYGVEAGWKACFAPTLFAPLAVAACIALEARKGYGSYDCAEGEDAPILGRLDEKADLEARAVY